MQHTRALTLSMLLLAVGPGCDDSPPQTPSGRVDFGAAGKADGEGALSVLGAFSTQWSELPSAAEVEAPLLDSRDLPDLTDAARRYDETFQTGGVVQAWLADAEITEDDVYRAAMFASAHEHEVRDDAAVADGVEWGADDLRAAYALAWLGADEALRLSVGDGDTELNPALFHVAYTQLLAEGHTVVSGGSDGAGAVFDGYEIEAEAIDRARAEAILRHEVDDAAVYYRVFASITTTRGFASERYIIAVDESDEIVAGYWTPSNDALPNLHPRRLWIAPERPSEPAAPVSFEHLDRVRAAFGADIPPANGDTWMYTGEAVPFFENEFYCAKVDMEIPERFAVGDITVRASFSPEAGESWDHELAVSLYHAPAGNGPSVAYLAGGDADAPAWEAQQGEWATSVFNFEGSDSTSWAWQLRVCDVGSWGDDRDAVTGYVNAFEIEFHAL
jgi:hypothetical protein